MFIASSEKRKKRWKTVGFQAFGLGVEQNQHLFMKYIQKTNECVSAEEVGQG